MKCRVCRGPATIDIRRHNANFCGEHFLKLCRDQTAKAIAQFDMLQPGDRVLVAVSGGKDSLAVWDILNELGYDAEGFYIGLGIGEYSDVSAEYATRFAHARNLTLHTEDLLRDHGFDVPHGSRAAKRAPCSACGLTKRHLFDEAARRGGYDAIVTGHNLDDEAAVLMGNVLHWHTDYLARQTPMLPARDGFPKKAKPLVRLTERETAAYCVLRGIDYLVDECPMAVGNKHLAYKEQLNELGDLLLYASHVDQLHDALPEAIDLHDLPQVAKRVLSNRLLFRLAGVGSLLLVLCCRFFSVFCAHCILAEEGGLRDLLRIAACLLLCCSLGGILGCWLWLRGGIYLLGI